jgi:adenylate kinase
VHISAGDLLREQVALGTPEGKRAKEFMDAGALVPDEVVVDMVKSRLAQDDAVERGWLLDGYPRSGSQAEAIEREGIRPDIFLLLEVPDELLVERVVGRRMDPQTGAIYHLKYNPPPAEAVSRLVQRSDDTEEKAVARLETHHRNVDAVMGYYADKCVPIKGDRGMAEVFGSIETALDAVLEARGDPMEAFCEGNPSEPECRVYDE